MIGRPTGALTRAAGAFLTIWLFPSAGDRAALFGASGSTSPAAPLHPYDFVKNVVLHLCAKDSIAQFDLAHLLIL
jgi:hypothetical protein